MEIGYRNQLCRRFDRRLGGSPRCSGERVAAAMGEEEDAPLWAGGWPPPSLGRSENRLHMGLDRKDSITKG
uniref:Uncharacterized protein n=1 Tax=Oryza punctata TaxID=4537 RepID=A0A0E0KBQ6_ORYPU